MIRPRLAMALLVGLLLLASAALPQATWTPASRKVPAVAEELPDAQGSDTSWLGEPRQPVPAGARVLIELDKKQYFLGENVLLQFCIANLGKKPFQINVGGDYRFASRALRFSVEAFDAKGRLCEDPDPSGFCEGGISCSPTVEPGQKYYESVPLLPYRRIEAPGVYTIRVSHDLGWTETPHRKIPVAETTITFIRPNEKEARQLIQTFLQTPENHGLSSGQKNPSYRDFSVLRDPVYLPILVELAKTKSEDALEGIGSIATPEATEALIRLAGDDDAKVALGAAQTLDERLPDPQLNGELPQRNFFMNDRLEARRWLVKHSWRPRFADDVAELAHQFLAREDRDGIQCGAYMLQCVGRAEDLPFLSRALDREIAAAAKRPVEKGIYPRPRGACDELRRAAHMYGVRGLKTSVQTDTAGQALVFACAIGARETFRPEGWQRRYALLLQHEMPYVREVALDNLPRPTAEPLFKLLPGLIVDKDVDVQIAACHAAEKAKQLDLEEPLLNCLTKARDDVLLNAATNAAATLRDDWRPVEWKEIQIFASRLDEEGLTRRCLGYLADFVTGSANHSGPSDKWTDDDAKALKARWERFLKEHGAELKAGKRFKHDDPVITPDLFPGVEFYR